MKGQTRTGFVSAAVLLAMLALAGAPVCFAQTVTGSIVGSVTDQTGSAVPGAQVRLTLLSTGAVREAETDARGDFVIGALQPGRYDLSVELSGFKKTERTGIVLSASQKLTLGTLILEVGELSERVTVTATGEAVQLSGAERSGVVTTDQIDNLMTKSRNISSLLNLLPGVVDLQEGIDSLSRTMNLSIGGNRSNSNNISMDGMPLNYFGTGRDSDLVISQDGVAEVKALLSNYQAEYGRKSGAHITLVSKTGTKDFHGLFSYFKRHEQFNANNFFNNRTGAKKPRYRYNSYTYNIGGPIYIPGKFNVNKDKLFFFWNQEFWPLKTGRTGNITVPTELQRAGDFSQTVDLNQKLIPILDPYTRQQFTGNVVPASRINSSGQSLLKVFPLPNFTDWNVSKGAYNYIYETEASKPIRLGMLRIDYNMSANHMISGSYSDFYDKQEGALDIATATGNWPQMAKGYSFRGQNFLGRYTAILSPTFINELSVGFTRRPQLNTVIESELQRNQRDKVGFTAGQFNPGINDLNIIPNATFGGVPSAGQLAQEARFPFEQKIHQFSLTDNVSWTVGAHTLKLGITIDLANHFATAPYGNPFGSFAFDRNTVNPLDSNYAYSNAILGVFSTYAESNVRPFQNFRQRNVEWFAQDTWKVNRRLTLDYGLRFYWINPVYDDKDFMSTFNMNEFEPSQEVSLIEPKLVNGVRVGYNPVTGQTSPASTIGAVAPGSGSTTNGIVVISENPDYPRGLYENRGVQLAPRFGFAYDVFGNGKTAIRSGFGIYYQPQGWPMVDAGAFSTQPPLVITPTLYYGEISSFLSSAGTTFPQNVSGVDRESKTAAIMNFSFSVQQRLPSNMVVDVGYSGSLGRNLLWTRDLNTVPTGTRFDPAYQDPTRPGTVLPTAFLTPVTGYLNINQYEAAATSNYHSLQVSANRRFSAGLQFGASWTWSKAMSYVDSEGSPVSMLVPIRVWNYGLASFDRTHVLKVNWVWNVPKTPWQNPVAKTILNDWQVSGIVSMISGSPLGIGYSSTTGADITGTPSQGARPVVVADPVLPKSERTFARNFNTDAFKAPAKGTFGDAAKTNIRGPGINNWDLSLFKNFPIKEALRIQFRWELYNAFNHTQFSGLDSSARFDALGNQVNAQFGQFTSARAARIMQFGIRLTF